MLMAKDVRDVAAQCEYPGHQFLIRKDGKRLYLQVQCNAGINNVTGRPVVWRGRKWMLSPHMTKSEVVQTAFKAVLTALEHEAREQFTWRGRSIFDAHYDVDRLWELRGGDDCLDERASPELALKSV